MAALIIGHVPAKTYRFEIDRAQAGARVDAFTKASIQRATGFALSRGELRALFGKGNVLLGGRVCDRCSARVTPGSILEVKLDSERMQDARGERPFATGFTLTSADIRFEDDDLLFVSKPSGLLTHASTHRDRANLFDAVRRYLGPHATPALHHRLDVDTSGLVLFTKRATLNAAIATLFSERLIEKVYWAWVSPSRPLPASPWRVENHLGEIARTPSRYGAVERGGLHAVTEFDVLRPLPGRALVGARPKTGRTHQIRVHLSECGLPILGDRWYGGPAAPRLMLHARGLNMVHPGTAQPLEVIDEPPEAFGAGQ